MSVITYRDEGPAKGFYISFFFPSKSSKFDIRLAISTPMTPSTLLHEEP